MEKNSVKKLEITIKNESQISSEFFSEFIENFNVLNDENTKIRIMLLVKDLVKLQKKC